MTQTTPLGTGMLAALASPLPQGPSDDLLTPDQWEILLSIVDTIIPSITTAEVDSDSNGTTSLALAADDYNKSTSVLTSSPPTSLPASEHVDLIKTYLGSCASSAPGFKASIARTLGSYTPPDARASLLMILTLLTTRAGSLVLTSSTVPFNRQTFARRTAILLGWSQSYLSPLRALFRSLSALTKKTWLSLSPVLPKMIGFPNVPPHGTRNSGYEFNFVELSSSSSSTQEVLTTDILVIGSGCGAGVCASNLASAGHRVLVVEKSYHFPSTHYPMQAEDAGTHLFENGGIVMADDGSTAVIAGSTFGGGGTVNWSASLQPQHFVRQEWADEGLDLFTSAGFQASLDRICDKMGVGCDAIEHNFANRSLLEGARRLGLGAETVPQNTAGKAHLCGYCGAGCAAATKQGPANCWLPDAARNGAQFMQGCEVKEVLFENTRGKRRAVGARAVWTSQDREIKREVEIRAKRVIVSCGTLQSPLLLMRSGVQNYHLGRNLHLHPTTLVGAVFDQETRPWEGGILTAAVTALEDQDGRGHGPKIEIMCSTPGLFLSFTPWKDALDFKTQCAKFHHMIGLIVIERDRDTGRVYPDPTDGKCRVAYTPSTFDLANSLEGMLAASKIAHVMGAREIFTFHPDGRRYVRAGHGGEQDDDDDDGINEPAFQTWLDETRRLGLRSPDPCTLGSAHQMGTCRMSVDANKGVVDQTGRVHGTEGLYVADASVFPSASGVNPMVTTMGIADWISRGMDKELRGET